MRTHLLRVTVALVAAAAALVGVTSGPANAALVYQVTNYDHDGTSGVYLRNSSNINDVVRDSAHYVTYGTSVELLCWTTGSPVGPYSNPIWDQVRVVNGPRAGAVGYISEHWVNTPVKSGQHVDGEPQCGVTPPPPPPQGLPDPNGYPYKSMPCEHAPYATSGSGYWCKNYDWGPVHTTRLSDPSTISPYSYAYRNCTDFAAWMMAGWGVPASKYKGLGNANTWGSRAASHGVVNNGTPSVGSVAISTAGTYGHLGVVTAVNGSTITVAEYNKHQDGNLGYRTGTAAALGFSSFDHFK